jgi:prepilin-type processing-associated H-X9-DG protein
MKFTMDENLVGYLLHALDAETHSEVEAFLAREPEGRRRLELLRQALLPLAADKEAHAPPPDLIIRTLGLVAEHCSRDPVVSAAPVLPRGPGGDRPLWRRADLLVAACIFLLALGITVPALMHVRNRSASLVECQNNLREFYLAMMNYRDQKGEFPNVDAEAPQNAAGMAVPMLVKAGLLDPNISVRCPGNGPARPCPLTFEQAKAMSSAEFDFYASKLMSCYAYSLGYRDASGYHGPNLDPERSSSLPLMSDRPPYGGAPGNSPNHGGQGQNVLFQDGHVEFITGRSLPIDSDIFLNDAREQAAGRSPNDVVLGTSASRP